MSQFLLPRIRLFTNMLCDILLVHKDVGNDIKQGKDEVRKPIQEKGIEITISLEITSKPISSVFGPAS